MKPKKNTGSSYKKKKKKIIVTGGAGYIGSHTIIELLNAGYEVVSIDNFCHSTKDTFKRIKKITGIEVKNYAVDLCNPSAVFTIFKKEKDIAGVIHFAALKSVPNSLENPIRYFHNNLGSLIVLLEAVQAYKISGFVFSSSCVVYGDINKLPVSEKNPFGKANSPYARTKQIGEQILEDCSKKMDTKMVALRYFNPVGAHESGLIGEVPQGRFDNLMSIVTEVGIGKRKNLTVFGDTHKTRDGTCVRDYIHVSDIAQAHIKALEYVFKKDSPAYDVFNLGTGKGVTIMEMIRMFEKVSGKDFPYSIGKKRPGDISAVYSNSQKAKKVLGWIPKRTLKDMVSSAWKWQQVLYKE